LGTLVIRLTGGSDNSGPVGDTLLVSSPSTSQEVEAKAGEPVTLRLPPDVYSIKATDGKACMTGVRVSADAIFREAVLFPHSGCEDSSGPPIPSPPGGLPSLAPPSPPGTPTP
jgi:hypothetical protein